MIRVLYTIPNFDTAGSGKALLKIATRLDKEKFEPHIACMHDRGEFFKVVKDSGIPVHILQYTTPMIPRLKGLLNCWKISRLFKKIKPDIVHSFHYSADYSEALAARMAGIKWIFTKKNMNWGGGSKNAWKLRSKLATWIIVQNTDMVKNFYPKEKNIYLIPRGVDTEEFQPREPSMKLKQEFGISNEARIILSVANLVPVKGIDVLIKAFKHVTEKYTQTILFIVGDSQSEYAANLKILVNDLGLSKHVNFTGERYDVKDFHSIADIFVLPTHNTGRQEGSPVSLLEAMASGVLVIASDVAGIRDQLRDLPDQLSEPANSNSIFNKIDKFFQLNQQEIGVIISKQTEIVQNNFTINREVKNHQTVYLNV